MLSKITPPPSERSAASASTLVSCRLYGWRKINSEIKINIIVGDQVNLKVPHGRDIKVKRLVLNLQHRIQRIVHAWEGKKTFLKLKKKKISCVWLWRSGPNASQHQNPLSPTIHGNFLKPPFSMLLTQPGWFFFFFFLLTYVWFNTVTQRYIYPNIYSLSLLSKK